MGVHAAANAPGPGSPPDRHPLSDAQAEKWLGSRYGNESSIAFNLAFELEIVGHLDVDALTWAVNTVAQRHEVLAMRFDPGGDAQVHQPPSQVALQLVDLRAEPDPEASFEAFAQESSQVPFNPAQPPLLHLWLVRLSALRHKLLICAHHLVVDGWSLRVSMQDIAAHYNHRRQGGGWIPHADSWIEYVHDQRKLRDGEIGRRALDYWVDRFRDPPELLKLPSDYPRRSKLTFSASTERHQIDQSVWRGLKQAARRQGVTRFALMLGAYFILLQRITGQRDLTCAVPFTNIRQGCAKRLIGDTEDTLPLRINLLPDESFDSLTSRIAAALKEASNHQDTSLGRIVRALKLSPEQGRMTLVETVFNLVPAMTNAKFDGLDCEFKVRQKTATPWEVAWHILPTQDGVTLEVQHHRDLFKPETVNSWCLAYLSLLEQIALGEPKLVSDLSPSHGAGSMLENFDGGDAPAKATLTELLTVSFSRHSDQIAACCGEESITYRELDQASTAVASALLARGIGQGSLVGVCTSRSLEMLVALVGVLRSGAAYVPLDPAFPEDRLLWMADHSRLQVVLTDNHALVPAALAEGRTLLGIQDALATVPIELPAVSAEDLAYVLYTSGSTGRPKGVKVLHRNVCNFLQSMQEKPGFSKDDVICSATTLSFDIAVLELYLPLLCGARIVIADDREHRDPEALSALMSRHGATVFQTTPSLLSLLLEVRRQDTLSPLRLFIGGEAMPPSLARKLVPMCRELWNMYGPTETTVWSTVARVDEDVDRVPLGKPISNTRIHVLDDQGNPVMAGAIGEIWIGGDGVAAGYLHRDDLTAERFVPDTIAGDGSRMYRTGDLGQIKDGDLYFQGRVDQQIKLRGFRIEPGEIEAVAASLNGVTDCVVVARELPNGDGLLVLYVASSDTDTRSLSGRLRDHMARELPAYMRPHRIVVLERLPKTPNGKLDRRALPEPGVDSDPAPRKRQKASDPLERELAMLWQKLLHRGHVAPDDNFFEIGGYSMLAVRMFAAIHERFGVNLPLAALIEHPTVAELALAIRSSGQTLSDRPPMQAAKVMDGSTTLVELERGGAGTPLFLLHAVGGNVLNYLQVAQVVSVQRPVYGIQSLGLDGEEPPLTTVQAMADRYAGEIRKILPDGPYLLAGASMGGVLALEVARRLQDAGREIAFLGLIDTYRPGMSKRGSFDRWLPWRLLARLADLGPEQRRELRRRIAFRAWHLPLMLATSFLGRSGPVPHALRIHQIQRTNHAALEIYDAKPYDGDVTLFTASDEQLPREPLLGWHGFVNNARVIDVPGRHDNIVEQPELARRMRECLDGI